MQYPSYGRLREQRMMLAGFDGGIDAQTDDTALSANQLRDCCNLWWKDGALRTRPGLRPISGNITVSGIRQQVVMEQEIGYQERTGRLLLILHDVGEGVGLNAYFCCADGVISIIRQPNTADWSEPPTQLLPIPDGEALCLLYADGLPYRLYADSRLTAVPPYIPTVAIAARGSADYAAAKALSAPAGTSFEAFNRLTDAFRVEYLLTEGLPYFTLPALCRYRPGTLKVQLVGKDTADYTAISLGGYDSIRTTEFLGYRLIWSPYTGVFWFTDKADTVCVPDTEFWSFAHVTYTPAEDTPAEREKIAGMRFGCWFGGTRSGLSGGTRCFLAGNVGQPSLLCYSSVEEPTYFPENGDLHVGQPGQPVTALKKQADMLVIFKEREVWYTSYQVGNTDQETLTDGLESGSVVDVESAMAVFPLALISPACGCDCPETLALCDNRLVWTNRDGRVYALVSGNIYSERNLRSLGESIAPLVGVADRSSMIAADWQDHYFLQTGQQVFLFDYNAAGLSAVGSSTTNRTLRQRIAWYRWEFPDKITPMIWIPQGDRLALLAVTNEGGIQSYVLSGEDDRIDGTDTAISSSVQWPVFTAGVPEHRKTVREIVLDTGAPGRGLQFTPIGDRIDRDIYRRRICTDRNGFARIQPALRRVRCFSFRLEAAGTIALRGAAITIMIHG